MEQTNSLLIVDDDVATLTELTHILRPDYKIYTAKDGTSALLRAHQAKPDLIMTDVVMPDMNGFEVLEQLKASDETKDIPVIFITGLNKSVSEEAALAKGAVDFIPKPFSPAIVKLRLAIQIKLLNQMRTIERLSLLDHLTNLPNRRSFEKRLAEEWNRSTREQAHISALVMDVDNFKNYNDTHGHTQGDKALKAVSDIFNNSLKRPGDYVARWGGEEFIVLLSHTDAEGAIIVAEGVRKLIEELEIPCFEKPVTKVTISIGANTRNPGEALTIDEFISRADTALFQAKNSGKNKVCSY